MNLIIDQGNTSCKIAVYDKGEEPVAFCQLFGPVQTDIEKLMTTFHINAGIYVSVANPDPELVNFLQNRLIRFIEFCPDTPVPLNNAYHSPETLGLDRLAAAVGAWTLQPGKPLLVIDMGTAITYDYVSTDGTYQGGNIAPGLHLRLKALHQFTGRLPEVMAEEDFNVFGIDTESAIRAGVMQGILYETEGYLYDYKQRYPDLFAFLTGGDAFYFAERLKNGIFVSKNLVLAGLNRILNHNV